MKYVAYPARQRNGDASPKTRIALVAVEIVRRRPRTLAEIARAARVSTGYLSVASRLTPAEHRQVERGRRPLFNT